MLYYKVRRKHEKLPSKVFTDFAAHLQRNVRESHPHYKGVRKNPTAAIAAQNASIQQ